MISLVRISIFIILSIVLHVVSLAFEFDWLAQQPVLPRQVKIGYVVKSVESFRPAAAAQAKIRGKETYQQEQQQGKFVAKIPAQNRLQSSKGIVGDSQRIHPENEPSHPTIALSQVEEKKELEASKLKVSVFSGLNIQKEDGRQKSFPQDEMSINEEAQNPLTEPSELITSVDQHMNKHNDGAETLTSVADLVPDSYTQDSLEGYQPALPYYENNPRPEYPRVAKLKGWEGDVMFEISVLKNGMVGHLELVTSSGYKSLDSAARKAIKRWRFKPATVLGLPVDSQVRVPIKFSLRTP